MEVTAFPFAHIYMYISPKGRAVKSSAGRRPGSKSLIPGPALPRFTDQMAFDITIACANEYGAGASAKLFGVEILNEGFGTSIDDTVIEQQATFVAQTIAPLQALGNATLIAGA